MEPVAQGLVLDLRHAVEEGQQHNGAQKPGEEGIAQGQDPEDGPPSVSEVPNGPEEGFDCQQDEEEAQEGRLEPVHGPREP